MLCFIRSRLGLIFNFIGTIMVGFSFGKSIVGTEEEADNGKVVSTASFTHPWCFRIGILFLALGFLVSMLNR